VLTGDDAPHGGPVGLILDARERPLVFPTTEQTRIAHVAAWNTATHTIERATGASVPLQPTPADAPHADPDPSDDGR